MPVGGGAAGAGGGGPRGVWRPSQYFDRTKGALNHTFFGNGVVAHVSFGDPACPALRAAIAPVVEDAVRALKLTGQVRLHTGGTYVCMEGPAFSTRAESQTYRRMGFDVIGMTSLPEAKLCREAEICYQAMAMVTDYDCWHATEEEVTVEMIIANLQANTHLAKQVIRRLAAKLPRTRACPCQDALKYAVLSDLSRAPADTVKALKPILGKYLKRK
jgi:5'-methylthioadenosine phosphorylase